MSSHTSGPWFVDAECAGNVCAGTKHQIALVTYSGDKEFVEVREERAANARLISAATDLLEAAEDAIHSIEHADAADEWVKGSLVLLRIAVAKARGAR